MNEKEILKLSMKEKGISQQKLAEAVGYSAQGSIGKIVAGNGSLRVDTFVKLLNAMGYDVTVKDRVTKRERRIDYEDQSGEELANLKAKMEEMKKRIKELESSR